MTCSAHSVRQQDCIHCTQTVRTVCDRVSHSALTGAVLDALTTGIILLDADERVLHWNPWLEASSGLSCHAVIGRPLFEVFPGLHDSRLALAVQSALGSGLPSALSNTLNRSPFPLYLPGQHGQAEGLLQQKINVLPLRSAEGNRHCLIEIFDVSAAIRRDRALQEQVTERRQAEATARALLDAPMESALLLDRQGIVRACNAIAAARFNHAQADMLGLDFFSLLPDSLAQSRREFAEKVFTTGQPAHFQDCRNGTYFDINVYPVQDTNGKVVRIAVYAADVTERRRAQAIEVLFHNIDERILRGQPIQELLTFICEQVASIHGFPAVWIGRKQANGNVGLQAWAGSAASYREQLQATGIRWDNSPLGHGPGGSAIRTGKVQQARVDDSGLAPWRNIAEQAGLRAFLSLPLILAGEVYGSFTLSAPHSDAFAQHSVVQHMGDIANRICIALEKATDHQQLRLLRTALANAANGVFITDQHGHIEWVNGAFLRMSGFAEEEALGATPNLLRSPRNRDAYFAEMWETLLRGEVWSGETMEKRKDGSEFTAYQIITPILNGDGATTHYISILEDITEKKAAEERIRRLAHYDQLTDLPNRALFHDRLHTAISRARREDEPFALMFLDLDRFKQVNDTYGHDTGDLLLREVAQRLRSCVRDSDSVARLAGDEFTLLLPGAHNREEAAVVARKIIDAMAPPIDAEGRPLHTSPSIGIAFYPQDGSDEPSLLRAADQAMYTAKAAGRNTYAFYQALG